MINRNSNFVRLVISVISILVLIGSALTLMTPNSEASKAALQSESASQTSLESREAAYRANNIGVALLEQFKYEEAAAQFRRALKIDPHLAIGHLNLCIALFNVPSVAAALPEGKIAAELLPSKPQPFYMLGLIGRSQNKIADAITAFKRVLEIDPDDVGANVNLGQLYSGEGKFADAEGLLRTALAVEPYNITASYNLAIALIRSGKRDEGLKVMSRFQALRQSGYGTTIDNNYLSQGRYAEAVASTGDEPDLVDPNTPKVTFTDATAEVLPKTAPTGNEANPKQFESAFGRSMKASEVTDAAKRKLAESLGGGVVLFDFDGDGDLDLFEVTAHEQHLYRNDCGKFVDVTAESGLVQVPADQIGIGAVAGDYDNDGKPDLFVIRYGGFSLYHNDGNGKFTETTKSAGIPSYPYLALSAAMVDVDHDGDLDIFVAGFADLTPPAGEPDRTLTFPDDFKGAPNLLLRNDGNGKFTDITTSAKVTGAGGHAIAVVPTDFDNHRDVDIFVLNYGSPPTLFSNMRDGSFRDVAAERGLNVSGKFTSVAAGDYNKDGYTDFFLGKADGPGILATSDGRSHFKTSPGPAGSEGATGAQFLDYDNDGLLDLVTLGSSGLHVLRNIGSKFADVSGQAAPVLSASMTKPNPMLRTFASGDINGDGADDLIVPLRAGQLKILRNNGGSSNHRIKVILAGKVSNRGGVGSKVEVRAGSLWQKLETSSATPAAAPADVIFGLGKRTVPDAIRVLWPSGTVQAEIEIPQTAIEEAGGGPQPACSNPAMKITELDRKPSSCPFLYTWNGKKFEFITDFMGGGEMGDLETPGHHDIPDPDEYVRIRGDQLKPRDGRYEIRVTNELEEVAYVDKLQLVAVDHPADTEVYPNEGLKDPPRPPFKLYVTEGTRPPISAVDDRGRDELPAISRLDRKFVDDFHLNRIRGYAHMHSLTMDVGQPSSKRIVLLMTGWTDYAFSSDNLAASQMGMKQIPPYVQVKDSKGQWRTVISDMGFPVGRPQTVVVDMTGKFLSASSEVRVVTNMRIYWDRILVDSSPDGLPVKMTRLNPSVADLHWRGYSAQISPDGKEPFGYDYDRVSTITPWKLMPGSYTRTGDVRALLDKTDDMFVVSRPGDEISLSFDAGKLPALAPGWKRTFLLYVNGFSKEMDINSASPDRVAPLPFHAMTKYPYSAPEAYPMTPERRKYIDTYNTRVVTESLPPIEDQYEHSAMDSAASARAGGKDLHR